MTENYERYITRSIRSVYRKKLFAPFLYIVFLVVLWFVLPIPDILQPTHVETYEDIVNHYKDGTTYIQTEFTDLYFTGYTKISLGQTSGYYYYTVKDDTVMFVLLSPTTSVEGLPHIDKVTISGKVLYQGKAYQQITDYLAKDLSWTSAGIKGNISSYIFDQPSYYSWLSFLIIVLFFLSGLYAALVYLVSLTYLLFPILSPPCRRLGRFGKASALLAQAEEELATLPQLATEDMFITEHFFIEIAASGIAIVPIKDIIWIYKHSTLHKILWYHFNISYTLHIATNKRMHIQCPKNIKSDIDGIIDYLAEANHNILVGFSEKNRLKVQEMQQITFKFEKLIQFLKRRY